MLVDVKQLKRETNHSNDVVAAKFLKAKKDSIETETLAFEMKDIPLIKEITKGNILSEVENLAKRKEMIVSKSLEDADFAYSRAIGKNDSLHSNFTELLALTKRKVARIVLKEGNKRIGFASGFMVSNNLMLTNWHVFKNDIQLAIDSDIHFFYEYDARGNELTPTTFKFDTTKFFFSDEQLDYCFVALRPMSEDGNCSLENISYLYLEKGLGKIGNVDEEKLNIIHHPQGDYKQISIRENTFKGIENTKIFYETDTAQGSSGSPVFNDQWQVVGLHHKSIAKISKDGKNYLDKDDNVIPEIDGKIDITRVVWLRNEGIRISVILNHLSEKKPDNDLVAALAIAPPIENLTFTINQNENRNFESNKNIMSNEQDKNIVISVPASVLNNENSIDISLSSKKISSSNLESIKTSSGSTNDELQQEVAKADKEAAVDFSQCKGYDSNFLGIDIPMPQPKKAIEKQIALLKNKTNELKYFKYSVIFNAAKKLPVISAINVEGDASKRLDNSKRKDDWLRDKRIDIECQLTDGFYKSSKFDKGHMGRFEDANWDTAKDETLREENALMYGIYTCFYTNACPQVPGINRQGENLWGKLEKAVLEQGIKKQKGKQARMTVFNGPIFDEEKDRVRKGVVVPMQFYKIILWLTDDGKLKATGFKLSQETLVSDDQFDESLLADEALDIDKLVAYKNYRCSIKRLSSLTKIDFSKLEKYDTFKTGNGEEESLILNEESITI